MSNEQVEQVKELQARQEEAKERYVRADAAHKAAKDAATKIVAEIKERFDKSPKELRAHCVAEKKALDEEIADLQAAVEEVG